MSEKYLIGEWVGFVQQIQHLVSRGYTEYCLITYPLKKQDRFKKIDKKLIEKYNCNLNKDKTYYRRKKKIANFKFLRWENTGIYLKTKGDLEKNIVIDDDFKNVKNEKISIAVGERAILEIGYDEKEAVTVHLSRETYREVRATCLEYIDSKNYKKAIKTFNNLNALPAWGGIVKQKIQMKEYLMDKMKKNKSKKEMKKINREMRINTKRIAVKVFE